MKTRILLVLLLALTAFLVWRFVRPMQIFVVAPAFEQPVATTTTVGESKAIGAASCGECHREFYDEWSTSMHSQAWTDPYFQVDWQFDGSAQICKNCHIPLDRQQEQTVVGFYDVDKLQPMLAPNPDFDAALQHEGVTCAACHLREGKILGVLGGDAPHPVQRIASGNEICVRCHVAGGQRWDTFYRLPPCGTVAEIRGGGAVDAVLTAEQIAGLGCVDCHMPLVARPLAPGGPLRQARRHLWRGGHDPDTVRGALRVEFDTQGAADGAQPLRLSIANIGADHALPTGTPDRHLTVSFRLFDTQGNLLDSEQHTLKRNLLWRPFIIDLWDDRLRRGQVRDYSYEVPAKLRGTAAFVEAQVDYHLLDEARRRRIGYDNSDPIHYPVYRKRIDLHF